MPTKKEKNAKRHIKALDLSHLTLLFTIMINHSARKVK